VVVLSGAGHDEPEQITETGGAELSFTLAAYRMGTIETTELASLIEISGSLVGLSSEDPVKLGQRIMDV
jgi:hypothetical protein